MTETPELTNRALVIDPISRGYGYAVIEDEPFLQLIDWGIVVCRRARNCLDRVEMMIEAYEPNIIVLEECADERNRHCHAVNPFLNRIEKLAMKYRIGINKFSLQEAKKTFSPEQEITKQGLVEILVSQFPELIHSLPRAREVWSSEDYKMSIFEAVALGITALQRMRQ